MKYIEEVIQEFENAFVNMSPMRGRDMHNRPPLYDTKTRDVEEMKQFIQSALQKQIEMIEGEVESSKKEISKPYGIWTEGDIGYNQAIDDILSILGQYK